MPVKAIQRDRSWKEIRTISSWLWVEGGSELITVNVSLFPGETKGHRIGRGDRKKAGHLPTCLQGLGSPIRREQRPGQDGESWGALTSDCWGWLCDLGQVTESLGSQFP